MKDIFLTLMNNLGEVEVEKKKKWHGNVGEYDGVTVTVLKYQCPFLNFTHVSEF